MQKLRTAVIGVGYLGEFHAEKFAKLENTAFYAVCDIDQERCVDIAARHNVHPVYDYRELIGHVDAVSIVVPTPNHYAVAKFFLEHHVHVLIEKPITTTVLEAEELISIANQHGLVLQVGHLERFNNVLHAVEDLLEAPTFIESERLAPFNPRGTEVNVMLDLMIHDIEILQYLVKSPIENIYANGVSILSAHTDIANARIQFQNDCIANVTASRVSFRKERRMQFYQHNASISVDFLHKQLSMHKKDQDTIVSFEKNLEKGDEIFAEISAFVNSIQHHLPAIVSGEDGKNALATAIRITELITKPQILEPVV